LSPASANAAATAAMLAPELVMLLRRWTRWEALRAPERAECVWELLREWEGKRLAARGFVEPDIEVRCVDNGGLVGAADISCKNKPID
jgi:hypothetical protein